MTKLISPNEEMNGIMKTLKPLEESDLLITCVRKTIKNEIKEQNIGFIGMLLGILDASSLGNLLTERGLIGVGESIITAGEGATSTSQRRAMISAGQNF